MGKTVVVNIHKIDHKNYVYIGRGSAFGNPYIIGKDGTRDEVIEKYRKDFYKKVKRDRFLRLVLDLKGKTLGCFCKPQNCHGDVLVEFLNNYKEE